MINFVPIVLPFLPFAFQLIVGSIAMKSSFKFKFSHVCIVSLLFQIIFSIVSFIIFNYRFNQSIDGNSPGCGMWIIGVLSMLLLAGIATVITILIQYLIQRFKKKKLKDVGI
ncbi:hypothetical protein B0A58_13385 [Flavobacterium branchiophilum NBRC 15030 = ATCC 35035]|uniref:Uncharacterized protein n=1 Tax=Flavobacterium branchiophilum TaxID=55197 RepID=A0A543G4F5_9FLAO|nr:hypothetical protein [Flavobacterium branchiophilum]OXA71831.1 hypothetical protein B0A58_13385 [Flavobacterium branchiophilum NBRC 15030 = ATCC 35035]TQM40983.1 hypothetical protein BC670_1912 [Flavobacterium branchiophilum]